MQISSQILLGLLTVDVLPSKDKDEPPSVEEEGDGLRLERRQPDCNLKGALTLSRTVSSLLAETPSQIVSDGRPYILQCSGVSISQYLA